MGNAPLQMGIKTHKPTYQHGETMTGTVYISVSSLNDSIQRYQGIHLSFTGNENVEIRIREHHQAGTGNNSNSQTSYRTERESTNFLHVEIPLTTFDKPLRVAKYEFPFEWQLPDSGNMPSSFRHRNQDRSGHCEVQYTLSAFLVPQERQTGFFQNWNTKSGTTSACQNIQLVGAPTRAIPDPIHLAEERTSMNGLCCCWKQGDISLGWAADSIVMTPLAPCHLQIMGFNASSIPVQYLRIQLIESIHWRAGGNDFEKQHTRSHNSTLVDFNADISHLPQWNTINSDNSNRNYQSIQGDDPEEYGQRATPRPVITNFQVPADVKDSYQGRNCNVEHTLIVSAVTRFLATTPQVPYTVYVQRTGTGSSPAEVPMATAWMEEADYQDVVLPSDWSPDEKVPVIHLDSITPVDTESVSFSDTPTATAHAVMVEPSAPPLGRYSDGGDDDDPLAFARPAPSAPAEEDVKKH